MATGWINAMSDDDKLNLRPASAHEIEESLSFALRFSGRKRVHHADDAMARITAERLVQHLERSGFVLMKRPPSTAPSTSGHSHPTPSTEVRPWLVTRVARHVQLTNWAAGRVL